MLPEMGIRFPRQSIVPAPREKTAICGQASGVAIAIASRGLEKRNPPVRENGGLRLRLIRPTFAAQYGFGTPGHIAVRGGVRRVSDVAALFGVTC